MGTQGDGEPERKKTKLSNHSTMSIPFTGENIQFHCDYCQKDITRTIRVKCAVCENTQLCIECFSVGVEISGHLKSHAYSISDCLSFPVIDKDWTAEEELLLLEGVEKFGLGNWKNIAEHIGTKTDKKCEHHYREEYLLSSTKPLPRTIESKAAAAAELCASTPDTSTEAEDIKTAADVAVDKTTSKPNAENDPSMVNRNAASLPGSELAGYMPLRRDFDIEHDNDAELILADMEFSKEDHPTEKELKIRIIDIYNGKLDERDRRKQFVIERGLLDYRKHQQMERRKPKDERELIAQMRPFARFHSAAEHDEFVGALLTAMKLRKRIAQLQQYRKNGFRTLAEAQAYESEEKKRESEAALKKQRESASYLYDSGRQPQSGGRDRANRWLNRERQSVESTSITGGPASTAVSSSRLDIAHAPGADLLTSKEQELCTNLRLLPKHYMVIKDTLIRESFRVGYLKKTTAKQLIKIDVNKTGQIYDFFVTCGWISKSKPADSTASSSVRSSFTSPPPSSSRATHEDDSGPIMGSLYPNAERNKGTTGDTTAPYSSETVISDAATLESQSES